MTDNTINFDRTLASGGDGQRGYSLNIGDQLGQYRIMRPLGRGGMGLRLARTLAHGLVLGFAFWVLRSWLGVEGECPCEPCHSR